MLLDPALVQLIAAMPARPDTSAVADEDYAAVRAAAHELFALRPSVPAPDVAQADHVVPASGSRVRTYRPAGSDGTVLPVFIWIHGGGFTLGTLDADDERCRGYSRAARCAVASLEYRLAPEHPYPAGPDDCWDGLRWVVDHAADLQLDPTRVAIGGASAGGCLAAAMTQRTRRARGPRLAFQLLVYPMLDDRLVTRSSVTMTDVPIYPRRAAEASWRRYLRRHQGEVPADAAPARANGLEGLPPAFVLTADHDPLCDEGVEYALRLLAAGVPTELHVFAGTFHGFEAVGLEAPIVRRALDEQARALCGALHDPLVAR